MNRWGCAAKPCGTGFKAMVNRVDRAEPYPVSERGAALIFATAGEAELAAHRHVIELLNTELRFSPPAPIVPEAVSLEEKAFGRVTSRRGKTTTVQRRKRRQRKAQREGAAQAT